MTVMPRVFVSFFVSCLIFVAVIKFMHIQPDKYLPPPMLYKYATGKVYGKVTGKYEADLSEHLFEGDQAFYYINYTFTPKWLEVYKDGKVTSVEYDETLSGAVRVNQMYYNNVKNGDTVLVYFDPVNPNVNGVPDSLGVWSKTTGYINPYLWWYIGILAFTYLLQEIIRMATKTSDG